MRKEHFDFIYGLGSGCSCWRILRERGLQYAAFVLDWVGLPGWEGGEGLRKAADLVAGGFAHWFEIANLERCARFDSPKHDAYFDRATGFVFAHDFLKGESPHIRYPEVAEKYARRIARFNVRMQASHKVMFVWISDPRDRGEISVDDINYAAATLKRRYPDIELRILATNCVPGIPQEKARIIRGAGFELYAFDYRVAMEGEPTWEVRTEMFESIFSRFACVDYRTRMEKRANAKREKAREYEKFKAKTAWQLLVNRLQFKIYRHFKRRLDRKGVLSGLE